MYKQTLLSVLSYYLLCKGVCLLQITRYIAFIAIIIQMHNCVLTLFKVQDDLRHLKEQIISHGVTTEVIDLRTLESAIERTEQSVRVSNNCLEC